MLKSILQRRTPLLTTAVIGTVVYATYANDQQQPQRPSITTSSLSLSSSSFCNHHHVYAASSSPSSPRGSSTSSPPPHPADISPLAGICVLQPDGNSGVSGVVRFTQLSAAHPTRIQAKILGLTDGKHGAHFNPFNESHGDLTDLSRHVGDMGNIVSKGGVAEYDQTDELGLITLTGHTSVIGRSVVVHSDPDDLGKGTFPDSKTTGHAGGRKSNNNHTTTHIFL